MKYLALHKLFILLIVLIDTISEVILIGIFYFCFYLCYILWNFKVPEHINFWELFHTRMRSGKKEIFYESDKNIFETIKRRYHDYVC